MRSCIVAVVLPLVCLSLHADDNREEPPEFGRLAVDPGGHTGEIQHLHFTPDGKLLLTGSFADQTIQLWDTATGERLRVQHLIANLRGHYTNGTLTVALSPDGQRLAVGIGPPGEAKAPPRLRLYDFAKGNMRLLSPPRTAVKTLTFSHDGRRLAATHVFGSDNVVPVWNLDTPDAAPLYLRGHEKPVSDLAFSPTDSGVLATAGGTDDSVRIWSLADRKETRTLAHGHDVDHVVWAPDGKRLASSGSGVVHSWRARGQQPAATFRIMDLGPTCRNAGLDTVDIGKPAFDLKGEQLLVPWSAGKRGDRSSGVSSLGVGGEGKGELFTRPLPKTPILSPNGRLAAIPRTTGEVRLITIGEKGGRVLGEQPGQRALRVAWARDNRTIAWGTAREIDGKGVARFVHSLNLKTLELQSHAGQANPPEFLPAQHKALGWEVKPERDDWVVLRPNGKEAGRFQAECCALADLNGGVLLVRSAEKGGVKMSALPDIVAGGTAREYGEVRDVAISPSGKLALTATKENMLQVYRTEGPARLLLSIYVRGDDWVAMTPEGYYAASPGADRMMGWVVSTRGVEHFIPVARLRQQIRRPDVIQRLLPTADLSQALKQANKGTSRPQNPVVAPVKQLLPPTVRLDVTERSKDQKKITVRATAEATVPDQRVESVQLMLDGRPIAADGFVTRFKPPVARGTQATANWTLELPPGPHRLVAVAKGKDSSAVSNFVDVSGPPPPPAAIGNLHQVCVGVSKYANHAAATVNDLNLKYAADDARLINAVLSDRCGTLFEPAHTVLLTDHHATAEAMLAAVTGLKNRVEQTDLVVIHFSGHGERDDNGDLWLLTHEADRSKPLRNTCLSAEKLKDALAEIPCRILLILDACHAAAVGRVSATNDLASLLTDEGGAWVLAAARGRELALEGAVVRKGGRAVPLQNGLFTWALQQALEGSAPRDRFDGLIYTHHVYDAVFSEVRQWSAGRQHPFLGPPWGYKPLPLVR